MEQIRGGGGGSEMLGKTLLGRKPPTSSFLRCKRGSVPVLTALLALPLVICAGGAIDFMRHETVRVELQDALDHGVLAAASLTRFETSFLHLAGISSMTVPAESMAEERRPNIEISILLDISGSMEDNGGIKQLKPAAKTFIDTILRPDVRSVTSVNYNYETPRKEPWWCPSDEAAMIVMSNDADAIKQKIENMKVYDGTGTAYAMKWASILLDPTIRPYMSIAAASNIVPTSFANRPANYNDGDTLKFIVLMTDGQISFQPRPKTGNYYYKKRVDSDFNTKFSSNTTQSQLDSVCATARSNGITVFTIGFKLSNSVAATLARCASSPSHAYRADGLDIADAFSAIATTIQKIKLTK